MTVQMSEPRRSRGGGFGRRTWAMLVKEFIQLKRDRVSFAMIVMIPLVQLLLFGYAINTNPRHLPTAVLLQEQSDLGRSILRALQNTEYFTLTHVRATKRSLTACWHPVRYFSRLRFRPASSAPCEGATGRRCWWPPTPLTRWLPVRRLRRLEWRGHDGAGA